MYNISERKDKAELNPTMDITWEDAHKDVQPAKCEQMILMTMHIFFILLALPAYLKE